ncbi:MAG: hypothetical protein ABIJ56_20065, partial [Pseudomonadota bacterium]
SYRATIGLEKKPEFLCADWILGQFRETRGEAIEAYKCFVNETSCMEMPTKEVKGDIFLGDDAFIEDVRGKLACTDKIKKVARIQRMESRPELFEIFQGTATKAQRNEKIFLAHKRYGYTLTEVSRFLKIDLSTASKGMKFLHGKGG